MVTYGLPVVYMSNINISIKNRAGKYFNMGDCTYSHVVINNYKNYGRPYVVIQLSI